MNAPTQSRRVITSAATVALAVCGLVAVAQPASAGETVRIAGTDRIDTSIKVWEENIGLYAGDRVVLARHDDYADALAATPGAEAAKSPILLNPRGELDSRVLAALKRHNIKNVGIVGGTSAISADVQNKLQAEGFNTLRVGGKDRFETARLGVAAYLAQSNRTSVPIYVATGINYPDALAAGAAAANANGVVLLSKGNELDQETAALIKGAGSPVVSVGGPASTAVKAAGINASPVIGATRYETAIMLADRQFTSPSDVVIASGQNFADALPGGVLAGLKNGPLLLSPPVGMNPATEAYLVKHKPNVVILGGFAAISAATGDMIVEAAKGTPSGALKSVLAPYAGQTLTGKGTTAITGGTLTTDVTVTVNPDGTYTVNQDFTAQSSGMVPTSETKTITTTLTAPDGRTLNLTQVVDWTSTSSFQASGTANADVVTSQSGTSIQNPSWTLVGTPTQDTTVRATVTSSIDGASAGSATATSTYSVANKDWSTPVFN